jgi:hypothetical protein
MPPILGVGTEWELRSLGKSIIPPLWAKRMVTQTPAADAARERAANPKVTGANDCTIAPSLRKEQSPFRRFPGGFLQPQDILYTTNQDGDIQEEEIVGCIDRFPADTPKMDRRHERIAHKLHQQKDHICWLSLRQYSVKYESQYEEKWGHPSKNAVTEIEKEAFSL